MDVPAEAAALKKMEASSEQGQSARWYRSPRVQLALCLALALAVRLILLARTHGMIDGDEAIPGIQADQLLQGNFPIYYAGQAYQASLVDYLAAPLIAFFGPSAWALHLPEMVESLLLAPLLGSLAANLYGERARLPAMLLGAVPPFFALVLALHAYGGYIETVVLGTALMLVIVKLSKRWAAQKPTLALWLWLGFLSGFAFWIDPLIILYVIGCMLWIAPAALIQFWKGWRQGWGWWRAVGLNLLAFLGTYLLGDTPAMIYALQNQFANYTFILHKQSVQGLRLNAAQYMVESAVPHIMGITLNTRWFPGGRILLIIGLIAGALLVMACLYTCLVLIRRFPLRRTDRQRPGAIILDEWWNYALPPLVVLAVFLVYWRTPDVGGVYALSTTDKYILPDLTAMLLMLACLFAYIRLPLTWLRQKLPALFGGLAHLQESRIQILLSGALLAALLGIYFLPYMRADAVKAWESPYWQVMTFPADHSDLLTYLNTQHIHYVWTNHWVGYVVMYLTDDQVLCYDYVDQVRHGDVIRFPETGPVVAHADRASFIIESNPADGEPAVAQALDKLGVTYRMAEFGTLWVINVSYG